MYFSTANLITGCRIVCSMLLLLFPAFSPAFYLLYIFCGVSDMLDGPIARRTHTETALGARLDSIADLVFVAACLVKILPAIHVPMWLWIWTGIIVLVKAANVVSGYVRHKRAILLHTRANKLAGLVLFLLPLALGFADAVPAAIPACAVATFAAVQEGHFIRTGRMDV
ncbi:MAG: CDP-alcohol phosphatidyltransferase family protein [Candidatus Aphodomorpha sp.]